MTKGKQLELPGTRVKGRKISLDFQGADVTSDAGLMLLRAAEERIGIFSRVEGGIVDKRQPTKLIHKASTMMRQRVMAIAAGYEDLNDADTLRYDPLHQSSANTDTQMASTATLCRFEQQQDHSTAWAVNAALVDTFIARQKERHRDTVPKELILDFDATDDPVHGEQQGRFFHGYYGHYCFLPLYVFCGEHLLCAYLRQANQDAATHSAAILKLLVQRLRQEWPNGRIIFRADSGFCRERTLSWCDRNHVDYVVGLAKNPALFREAALYMEWAEAKALHNKTKERIYGGVIYGAATWSCKRHVIVKAEHGPQGSNPRFVVSSLSDPKFDDKDVYEKVYCARGEMENRIKEQLQLFSDRTSSEGWWTNPWRMLLSALAYTITQALREIGLSGTELCCAQCSTIRSKLIKVGAVIVRNSRRIHLSLSSGYPLQSLWLRIADNLNIRPG